MRLVSPVWGPEWNNLQYAVLDVDRAVCERLLKLIDQVKKAQQSDELLLSHTYLDYAVQYFEAFPGPEELEEEADSKGGWVQMSEDIELPEPARAELPLLEVYDNHVHWTAVPKHGGGIDQVETTTLFKNQIQQYLEDPGCPNTKRK